MYLLDTNVVSELRQAKAGRADKNVVSWIGSRSAESFYISAVTLMELDLGVLMIERRDPVQGAHLRAWMDKLVLSEFSGRVLPVDEIVALRCSRLHVHDRRPERDAFIGATALVHGMSVVTRNVADFAPMGVPTIDPWQPSEG
ncbi:type II toxin-antitoxin system VapC family toxin [Rhizobiales bacterium Sp-1]|uniref:Type II toxin-antitoxin system VapC family toxin n=2 Tax=Segnochrobactrum spirostomi TaxID=2608987 RepID=A0A6A7XZD8_9HYPH|nr:type II toxin-antitoxin system VapC family toxin [Segnochrobactrum spirostomi]